MIRLSAVDFTGPGIFTLPFSEPNINQTQGWRYDTGDWHYALDFSTGDGSSFPVRATADGTVIYMGWDNGAGNTMVISHDQGGVRDAFRTIYVHLRNDPNFDVTNSWTRIVPDLRNPKDPNQPKEPKLGQFTKFLTDTGNPENGVRDPDPAFWGTDNDRLDFTLVGRHVARGQILGHAGLTGSGGCGCLKPDWKKEWAPNTHLHIVFARRDTTDNEWYIIDPYGIYGQQKCYPPYETDISNYCPRYPSAWIGNKASFPVRAFPVRKEPHDRIDVDRPRIPFP